MRRFAPDAGVAGGGLKASRLHGRRRALGEHTERDLRRAACAPDLGRACYPFHPTAASGCGPYPPHGQAPSSQVPHQPQLQKTFVSAQMALTHWVGVGIGAQRLDVVAETKSLYAKDHELALEGLERCFLKDKS
jgi:hypothetical protein